MRRQASVRTATLYGIDAVAVDVEIDVAQGLPSFAIVGLGDVAVQEARERVRSAMRASGYEMPNARIVVNLAPGPLRKHGTGFDLPIAVGLLVATGQVPGALFEGVRCVGELGLDGRVRSVPGMLAHGLACRDAGEVLLGPVDGADCGAVEGLEYRGLERLAALRNGQFSENVRCGRKCAASEAFADFADVAGQQLAIEALVIAAAGEHNILLTGPPGSGKTMLARRLPGILPPLSEAERLETALVHSVAGLDAEDVLSGTRPFRAPHHSASTAGLVGGGVPPRPGEVSLAHNGVLFLDEMAEFGPATLQCLRQPLEDGAITLVRAEGRMRFPSRYLLVGASNPCPCGFLGDPERACTCSQSTVDRYAARIGGPLMDRIDLVVEVLRPQPGLLLEQKKGRDSASLRSRVLAARAQAHCRDGGPANGLSGARLMGACAMDAGTRQLVEQIARTRRLSGRGITRVLKVARTVADLAGREKVAEEDVAVAIGFRQRMGS